MNFLALYRGDTVHGARLVAVTGDPDLVLEFAEKMLRRVGRGEGEDPVEEELNTAKRRALELVRQEVSYDR
jgi:hypothetical protein